jgi:hypothetical protein
MGFDTNGFVSAILLDHQLQADQAKYHSTATFSNAAPRFLGDKTHRKSTRITSTIVEQASIYARQGMPSLLLLLLGTVLGAAAVAAAISPPWCLL